MQSHFQEIDFWIDNVVLTFEINLFKHVQFLIRHASLQSFFVLIDFVIELSGLYKLNQIILNLLNWFFELLSNFIDINYFIWTDMLLQCFHTDLFKYFRLAMFPKEWVILQIFLYLMQIFLELLVISIQELLNY